jgi:hypothetical protein
VAGPCCVALRNQDVEVGERAQRRVGVIQRCEQRALERHASTPRREGVDQLDCRVEHADRPFTAERSDRGEALPRRVGIAARPGNARAARIAFCQYATTRRRATVAAPAPRHCIIAGRQPAGEASVTEVINASGSAGRDEYTSDKSAYSFTSLA